MSRVLEYFQVTSRDKIIWLPEKEYLKRLNGSGYRLGWIDQEHIYFGTPIVLSREQIKSLLQHGGAQ